MPAIRSATVVLPVPGLPVKDMCSVGNAVASAIFWRIRVFTGTSPTSSLSSCASSEPISAVSNSLRRSTACTGTASPSADRPPMSSCTAIAFALWPPRSIGMSRIAQIAAGGFLTVKAEAGLFLRPVDDEGNTNRLPAVAGIEAGDADVAVAIDAPAIGKLLHDARRVAQIEHRQTPHLPIGIAWMRVVGEFDVHRPALLQAILNLSADLRVGEIGQEREAALGYAHGHAPFKPRRWGWE